MTLRLIIILLISIFLSGTSYSFDSLKVNRTKDSLAVKRTPGTEKIKKRSIWGDLGYDLGIFAKDAGAYYTAPLRFSGTEWLWTGAFLGASALSFQADLKIKRAVGRNTIHTYNRDFFDAPTSYGFIQYAAGAAGALYAVGLFSRNDKIRVTGRLLAECLTLSGATVVGLRYLTGRFRPYYTDNPFKFTWFQTKNDTQSFPSGHVIVAFSTSTILAEQIDTWWARVILYSFASLTVYSRLLNNQHWFSDVFVGSGIGLATGLFLIKRERNREKEALEKAPKKKGGGFSIHPSFNGFGLIYKF